VATTPSSGSAVTISTTTGAGNETKTVPLPSNVPAGATIVLGVFNRTDETTAITGVSDGTNGAWSLSGTVSGPTDDSGGTGRSWLIVKTNSAAITTPADVSVTFAVGVSTQMVVGWVDFDGSTSALTLDGFATPTNTVSTTDVDSNAFAATGAGAIAGVAILNTAQTSWTADGAGESRICDIPAGSRIALFFESYATSGSYGFVTTPGTAGRSMFHVAALLEPGGGGGTVVPVLFQHMRQQGF
jgi:hypothetical protein